MLKSIARRIAQIYFERGIEAVEPWILDYEEYRLNYEVSKTDVYFKPEVHDAIRELAFELGWDGNHWDSPFNVENTFWNGFDEPIEMLSGFDRFSSRYCNQH